MKALSTHYPTPCSKVQCINCKQNYPSNNKKCPELKKRQDISKYKIVNKCSFREARETINKNNTDYNESVPEETNEEATQKELKNHKTIQVMTITTLNKIQQLHPLFNTKTRNQIKRKQAPIIKQ